MGLKPFNIHEFFEFIGKQGVMGLAIGFVLGGAVARVVSALIEDIVNPLLGLILGAAGTLSEAKLIIGPVTLAWGHLASTLIDFLAIALVVYLMVKWLRLEGMMEKKS
jgi:large conductance mechanosensitive channel